MTKIVCVSDSHCQLQKVTLPDGDLLIHAGDATYQGTIKEVSEFNEQLGKIKHKYKYGIIFCPGNHDWVFEKNETLGKELVSNATVLINESITISNIKIYSCPQTPFFYNWAFNIPRGEAIKKYWDDIPDDTDVLITHGPPFGILDTISPKSQKGHLGCEELYKRVMGLPNLKAHVFGHIHGGAGQIKIDNTTFLNASVCTENYAPLNSPLVIEL